MTAAAETAAADNKEDTFQRDLETRMTDEAWNEASTNETAAHAALESADLKARYEARYEAAAADRTRAAAKRTDEGLKAAAPHVATVVATPEEERQALKELGELEEAKEGHGQDEQPTAWYPPEEPLLGTGGDAPPQQRGNEELENTREVVRLLNTTGSAGVATMLGAELRDAYAAAEVAEERIAAAEEEGAEAEERLTAQAAAQPAAARAATAATPAMVTALAAVSEAPEIIMEIGRRVSTRPEAAVASWLASARRMRSASREGER